MTRHGHDPDRRLERELSEWLEGTSMPASPRNLTAVVERTRGMRQRPAWASLERWLPMAVITARPVLVAPLREAWFLLITLLVLALVTGGVIVGSRLLSATSQIPQGGAAVLAFSSADGDLYTVRADGTDRRQLTSGPERDLVPVWSPDGTRIAFRRIDGDTVSLIVMDAREGRQQVIDSRAISDTAAGTQSIGVADCWPRAPAWSPDGLFLAFTADGCGEAADPLVARAVDAGPGTPFIEASIQASALSWAPSPRASEASIGRIAMAGSDRDGATAIYIADMPPERGFYDDLPVPATRITPDLPEMRWAVNRWSPLSAPAWSPDGTRIATAAGTNDDCVTPFSGSMDAVALDVDGSEPVALAAEPGKEYNPIWSPDGTRLAFQRIADASEWIHSRPCTMAVLIADADGGNERRLQTLGTDDTQPPFWSPDGSRIVGNTVRVVGSAEHYDMYIETVDGSSPIVTIEDAGFATWQPVAAPLAPVPTVSTSPAS